MQLFSLAQLAGYLTFVLGVSAFLQRSDRRLKLLSGLQALAYAAHYALLGNAAAATSAIVSGTRSLVAVRYRSRWLAAVFVAVAIGLGSAVSRPGFGWLAVAGSCCTTVAVFTLHGVRMRLLILVSTALWLANAILSRSIGGVLLEATIATASIFTIVRMVRAAREGDARPAGPEPRG
ncbi:MAG TPA: YgjV family protein [Anaeromyxobacter sp.]|nr:YgjV family protein [Anaeromyxobacter sp.]